jgi:ABC-2 type transport system permease protein
VTAETPLAQARVPSAGAAPGSVVGSPSVVHMLRRQTVAQARLFIRNPAISVISLAMPIMLFVFFGIPVVNAPYLPGITLGTYMLASFAAYAVSSVMLFNYGVTIALDRGQKIDVLMRASPLPGGVFLAARTITALGFGVLSLAVLFGFAIAVGVCLDPATWLTMIGLLVLGSVPFIGLGFAVAYWCSPSAAPAVANLLYLFLAFGSGLLVRIDQMPDFVRSVAPLLPTYHFAQLSWGSIGAPADPVPVSLAWLAGWTVALFAIAWFAYRRETAHKFA